MCDIHNIGSTLVDIYIYISIYIDAIMKTMCSPRFHHNGIVATHALYYADLAFVGFDHSVCRRSVMATDIYIYI